jgi:hypothetical protein
VNREDPEAFLRAMLAPLSAARAGRSLPGVPFSYEAVANALVMLGLQVRAVDNTGAEHEGVRGGGGGAPEGSYEFWFWPPVAPEARRIRVIVSTLWEAAWAEVDIPGRS